jgi:methionyl-tRNA formyltransferase
VERAILAGDRYTGVCLMALDEGLDTGPVYDCQQIEIGESETAEELRTRLSELGSAMLVEALSGGIAALGEPTAQSGEVTYAAKIDPTELRLDWSAPASHLHRVVRLGGAWSTLDGRRLRIIEARPVAAGPERPGALEDGVVGTGSGGLQLIRVQPEGRAPMDAGAWLRGALLPATAVLGE